MAKSREINMNLPSADDLFTTQEERDHKNQEYVKNISLFEITDFPNHPFKVRIEYYGAAEPPVRCGESHLSGLTEPPHFVY